MAVRKNGGRLKSVAFWPEKTKEMLSKSKQQVTSSLRSNDRIQNGRQMKQVNSGRRGTRTLKKVEDWRSTRMVLDARSVECCRGNGRVEAESVCR
jgi:hypothetical protein